MSLDISVWVALIGALATGLFTYIFTRIADALHQREERMKKHHSSLVRLEHYLNEYLGWASGNRYMIQSLETSARSTEPFLGITWNLPKVFIIEKSFYLDLYNIQVINLVFDLNQWISSTNDDVQSFCDAYSTLREALLSQKITPEKFRAEFKEIMRVAIAVDEAQNALNRKVVDLLALTRILTKKDWPLRLSLFPVPRSCDIESDEIGIEVQRLGNEVNELQVNHQKVLRSIESGITKRMQ